jgi:5'-3' exonuclease
MGVERFFSSLRRDYNFIHKVNKKINGEHLLIDFNSIVHITSQFLLEQIRKEKGKTDSYTKDIFEAKLIDEVGIYIEDLLKEQFYCSKIISIIVCVDGVPSMAKINEQRKRRYMGEIVSKLVKDRVSDEKSEKTSFSWSRNNISPGTIFMKKMIEYLISSNFEERLKVHCINLKYYHVSGIDKMGEGEMKILHYIDNLIKKKESYKHDNFIIYSPDSDVIILLLMKSAEKYHLNLFMLRYDQQLSTYKNPVYNVIDINHFKKILYEYVSTRTNKKIEQNAVIMDIVFILTVFGDDFLPKLETVRVNTDINLIMDHYILNLIKYGYIIDKNKENSYEINIENFMAFLKSLQNKEEYFLRRNARYHVSSNYNRIVDDIVGYQMNLLRELIVEYLWKFIYYNKPEYISVSPINAHKHIETNMLAVFMNKLEPKIDKNIISRYTKMNIKNNMVWDKMLNIINDYYIEILNVIDGKKLKQKNIYSNEIFFMEALPNQLLKDIIIYFYLTYELPIKVPLKTNHDKIIIQNYKSTEEPHQRKLHKMNLEEAEFYKIEHKLDNYYKILNPRDQFYYDIYFKNQIDYHNYYKLNFENANIKMIISDYLKGFNWVVNYYHNNNPKYNNIDLTWYFRHNRSPLLKDIVNHTNVKLLNIKMNNTFDITNNTKHSYLTPLEHYLFVSPLNYTNNDKDIREQLIKAIGYLESDKINLIAKFIKTHPKYYYELNNIIKKINIDNQNDKIIDCSSSIFLSKCHLMFMENYISIVSFINDFRKII